MKQILIILLLGVLGMHVYPQKTWNTKNYISTNPEKGGFVLSSASKTATIYYNSTDYAGVIRTIKDLQNDMLSVCGKKPEIIANTAPQANTNVVIIGTIGKNPLIDKLITDKKINIADIKGKWEAFIIETLKNPMPGIDHALVIAGTDKRGTIFGIYDLCEQIGVSPWYWWADVKPEKKNGLYVKPMRNTQWPSVTYRGIFLNDEYPNLTRWVSRTYGTVKLSENPPIPAGVANYGSEFYSRIFEVILRLKGNYLWPAMWNNAFNEDDPENARLADEYGVVMGTSHQEPMIRAQKEWDRRYFKTLGYWNYRKHEDTLKNFWREGVRRNKNFESIVTMGLRGADDTEMAPGGPEANMALLESIVEVQRKILADEINPDVTKITQAWCLYKEVLDYYKAGMRVPDDITLLWAEDNWGNVRRLPTPEERKRNGGAGIYYHFDYHGGPRSYQWINTSPIPKIWDQMALSKQYGVDRIWIVNVGHFRGYEIPTEYFLKLAWNTNEWNHNDMERFTVQWATREFGSQYALEIADIVAKYTKYNGRRKPELLVDTTYSLTHYNEWETVVADYKKIAQKAEAIAPKISKENQDAYYHLVLFPAKACALVNELYMAAAKNKLYSKQGRASTNHYAEETRRLFTADTSLMGFYNREYAGGRWYHFMDQAHLGYMSWRDPPVNSLRAIRLTEIDVPEISEFGLSVEGSQQVWPNETSPATLPMFDIFNKQQRYIEIFNKGDKPFEFEVITDKQWIKPALTKGVIDKETRVYIAIDWDAVPKGYLTETIKINGLDQEIPVILKINNPVQPTPKNLEGFVESDGYVSMESEHFYKNIGAGSYKWIKIDDYGHTSSGMRATAEANAPPVIPGKNAPCLEYKMYLFSLGSVNVQTICGPVLNFMPDRPVRFAISFNDEDPQTITLVSEDYDAQNGNRDWEKSVSDNFRIGFSRHKLNQPGYHTLKIWMIDPGVVLQKIVVDVGGVKPSYLGPPESFFNLR